MSRHLRPSGLPQRLDLGHPPSEARYARGYEPLVRLLDELGERLDAASVDPAYMRKWEARAMRHLDGPEKDALMRVSEGTAFDTRQLPEERWKGLRFILLRRKGLPVG